MDQLFQFSPRFTAPYHWGGTDEEIATAAITKVFDRVRKQVELTENPVMFWENLRNLEERVWKAFMARDSFMDNCEKQSWRERFREEFAINKVAYLQTFWAYPSRDVRLVVDVETLPTPVWRQLLWYGNIDFQDMESFIRRITPEQKFMLRQHVDVVMAAYLEAKGRTPRLTTDMFPCFAEGFQNLLAERVNGSADGLFDFTNEGRYGKKSAIAHDFLGLGLGFPLYSDPKKDEQASRVLAKQFTNTNIGEFVVNQEKGCRGAYWWLYRTLRTKVMGIPEEYVELGSHVCPGFWLTILSWLTILCFSPVSLGLAAAGYLAGLPLATLMPFLVLGAVDLVLATWFLIRYVFAKIHQGYNLKFVKHLIGTIAALAVITVIGMLVMAGIVYLDWHEPVNWMAAALLIIWFARNAMDSSEKVIAPWSLPFFGPVLLGGLAVRGLWLFYRDHPKEFAAVLDWLVKFVPYIVGGIALFIALGFVAVKAAEHFADFVNRHTKVGDTTYAPDQFEHSTKLARYSLLGYLAGFIALLGYTAWEGYHSGLLTPYASSLSALSILFVICTGVLMNKADWDPAMKSRRMEYRFLGRMVSGLQIGFPEEVMDAILKNPDLYPKFGTPNLELILKLQSSRLYQDYCYRYHDSDTADLVRMFRASHLTILEKGRLKRNHFYILPYALRANGFRAGVLLWREENAKKAKSMERNKAMNRIYHNAESRINGIVRGFFAPVRFVGKVIVTLWTYRKVLSDMCPGVRKEHGIV